MYYIHTINEERNIMCKYSDIKVKLVGEDGNAFYVLGRVVKELREHGISEEEIQEFTKEAIASDYEHLLQTVIKTVEVC